MKEGWEYKKLGEVCDVQNGFAFNSKLFGSEPIGMPLIRIRDIKRGFSETYTSESCGEEFIVSNGDCLIGMDGDFNVGIWKGGTALLNQRVCKLVPSDKVSLKFLYYYIPERLNEINSKTVFTTVKHLSSKQIKEIGVPDISLSEQKRIVSYLDSAFAKIDAVAKNAEASLNEAKALFQSALSKMMEPKEGWEEKTLGELTSKITDGSHNPPRGVEHSNFMMLSSKNIRNDRFSFDNPRYLKEADFEKENTRTDIEKGDVLLTIVGAGLGQCCVYPADFKVTFQRSAAVIKPRKDIANNRFLMYVLQNEYENIRAKSNGAAQMGIYLSQLTNYVLSVPSLSTQLSIVATLDTLKSKVDQLQSNLSLTLSECAALKQALLRETFE